MASESTMEEKQTILTMPTGNNQNDNTLTQTNLEEKVADDNQLQSALLVPSARIEDRISLQPAPITAGYILSDNASMVSVDEMNQRREALYLFSSQQSMAAGHNLPTFTFNNVSVNYELTPFSSTLSSLTPLCRICQCPAETDLPLITPCRCDGSLKHIHASCLLKWIDISNRKHRRIGRASFCELCGYIYRKHKFVKYRDWKWPKVALRDRILHLVFAVSLVVMITCAVATVLCFITDNEQPRSVPTDAPLTKEEVITICCGITFFISFFVSMSAEIKAKKTIHQILKKCFKHNTVWYVENYCIANDPEYRLAAHRAQCSEPEATGAKVEGMQ
ncbi:E3 ubiquitin-protein ligase MARCHF8-like [Watersipora subatra]|uniref:E3 ubiquitin-protein ligase MARCHF8-like n=1 Tax=Watersipora subatra TaxID=2589382 RepID=UPI00355BE48D